jgi:hypothetical protein
MNSSLTGFRLFVNVAFSKPKNYPAFFAHGAIVVLITLYTLGKVVWAVVQYSKGA